MLNPLLQTSAHLVVKQIEYERTQSLISEAERALELIGRAIRMAGYRNLQSHQPRMVQQHSNQAIDIQKKTGYQGSDSLVIRHELSSGIDFDCVGNVLSSERTKNNLALQGFLVERQAGTSKGAKVNGGSLICQSLDRQGRMQNTTLMNGINRLSIEPIQASTQTLAPSDAGAQTFRVKLEMTDGAKIQRIFERTFSTRNLS